MKYLILCHAILGGVSLFSGFMAIISRKGSPIHRWFGMWFYRMMLLSAIVGINISILPQHTNAFLFAIGLFSVYLLLSGRRAVLISEPDLSSYLISFGMVAAALGMALIPVITKNPLNLILMTFAVLGLWLSIRDIYLFRKPGAYDKSRMVIHAGNMTGGYIAATTAFLVVNNILPGLWGWFTPTVIGTVYIIIQFRIYNKKHEKQE